jgi:tetratricopeptide (TPR) repeat protein
MVGIPMATQVLPWRSPVALTSVCALLLAAALGSPSLAATSHLSATRFSNSLSPRLAQATQEQDLERAQQLNQQAFKLCQAGHYAEAIPLVEQVLTIREEVLGPEHVDTIESLNDLAWLYNSVSRYEEAASLWQRVLTFHRQAGDRVGEGVTLNNIGAVYHAQGDYAQALDYYQQALTIHRDVGNRAEEGTTLNNIGLVYDNQGDYAQALDYYQQSLAITRQVGNRAVEGVTLHNIGQV